MDDGIDSLVKRHVKDAISDTQDQLLNKLDSLISSKLHCFEEKINSSQKDISEKQINKIQQNISCMNSYKFNRKSCEDQFRFNTKLVHQFNDIEEHMANPVEQNLQKAHQAIVQGKELLSERQKIIKLADSSELGWKVVQEYISNPLADDSEDEKKILRAEARASRKIKQDKLKKSRKSYGHPYTSTERDVTASHGFSSKPKPGMCFACGKSGHWRAECPLMREQRQSNGKISISFKNNALNGRIDNCSFSDEFVNCITKSVISSKNADSSEIDCVSNGTSDTLIEPVESPVGRLKASHDVWVSSGANSNILDVIVNGYKLPFLHLPTPCSLRNNKSAISDPVFVKAEIEKLMHKGCISRVETAPLVINPLTVAYNKCDEPRLVLDCRHINPFLYKFKFKYEDAKEAQCMFNRGDYLFTFDLKSAYHHIEIFSQHITYLGFSWPDDDGTAYYVFNVLPFGISTAGYIFTKLLKVVVTDWRSKGIRVIMYLDDGIGGDNSFGHALHKSRLIQSSLQNFGFFDIRRKM